MDEVKLSKQEVDVFFNDLGEKNSQKLIERENREKVLQFCKKLTFAEKKYETLPVEMKIGDRVYEVIPYLKDKEKPITGYEVIKRARALNACLGADDADYILEHQRDIPGGFYRYYFIFTNWNNSEGHDSEMLYYIDDCYYDVRKEEYEWTKNYRPLENDFWNHLGLLLRRIS